VYSSSQDTFVPPEKRRLGMIFQSYAIWPHMTVYDNVARPLREGWCKVPKSEVPERVHQALAMVGMEDMASRPSPLLSGGQQQRVALARSLAAEPSILLMDEPLSNLDARLRDEVREQLKELTSRLGVTVIYVTHDQHEAMDLADRIAVMHRGRISQIGSPREVYLQPTSMKLAEFMGDMNWVPGRVVSSGEIDTALGRVFIRRAMDVEPGQAVTFGMRPSAIELVAEFDANRGERRGTNEFRGDVRASTFLGEQVCYTVECAGARLQILAPWDWLAGESISFRLREDAISLFDTESGRRIDTAAPVVEAQKVAN
jgi:iron(III) transport system ATP-binding protein